MKTVFAVIKASFIALTLIACSDSGSTLPANQLNPSSSMQWSANKFLNDKRFNSVSIAIYDNGKSYTGHFGELTTGKSNSPTDKTLYELGSVSKLFTGALAAKAVLEKRINLDDDIRLYLANEHSDYSFDNVAYKEKVIRIRHLLTHTSGFPNIIPGLDSKETFFRELSQIKIHTAPGEKYQYSNTAPELMAYILERAYEQPYSTLLNELFSSIAMNDTSYRLSSEQSSRLTRGYNEEARLMPNLDSSLWGGAVGLHSNSVDLALFMKHQLQPDDDINAESHGELFSINRNHSIGYYWHRVKHNDVLSYRHHGGIYGMQNWLMIYPEENIGISVISNVSFNGVGDRLENLSNDLFADLLRMRSLNPNEVKPN